ncbi:Phosphoglucosamine mutase [bacterium HR39]|nr:Phosphoglucosamine mutase [bacterium HR39]
MGPNDMTRRLFGTDGIRGTANRWPMTAEVALALGRAAGLHFRGGRPPHRVVIGKDTRRSGYMLESALTAGFIASGMDVMLVGPIPTPGIAFLTRTLRCDVGVMISASHNPHRDNGIKLFGPDGFKLSDAAEAEIERLMEHLDGDGLVEPEHLGRARRIEDARGRYMENLKRSLPAELDLAGLSVVVDCAHGAAYHIAPDLLFELGAEVHRIGCEPNGLNINDGCGATAPGRLRAEVLARGADLGIALDGDADRVVLVDEKGNVVDGDQILALIARSWLAEGRLRGGAVAATVMSNLGLERFLAGLGLDLVRTKVGDRYVLEEMRARGLNVGGEQSGHIILTDFATTGDGLLAALQVAAIVVREGRPLGELLPCFEPLPQELVNLRAERSVLERDAVRAAIAEAERRLAGRGRLLVRPSGTEPVIRVMVECEDPALLHEVLEEVRAVIAQAAATEAAQSIRG